MTLVRGVDGCRGGWISVASGLSGGHYSWSVASSLRELTGSVPSADMIAIDVPIGLPDAGPRECDTAARKLLGPGRASSVFPAPIRCLLQATSHAEASAARESAEGKRISIQMWAIIPRIREVDLILRSDPSVRSRVREVHPEVCFFHMAGGRAMEYSKKRSQGREERRRVLVDQLGTVVDQALREAPKQGCSTDDLLDALAALWTARRIVNGNAVTLPENPRHDRFGLPMEMMA